MWTAERLVLYGTSLLSNVTQQKNNLIYSNLILSIHPFIHPSIYLSIYLSIYISI